MSLISLRIGFFLSCRIKKRGNNIEVSSTTTTMRKIVTLVLPIRVSNMTR